MENTDKQLYQLFSTTDGHINSQAICAVLMPTFVFILCSRKVNVSNCTNFTIQERHSINDYEMKYPTSLSIGIMDGRVSVSILCTVPAHTIAANLL